MRIFASSGNQRGVTMIELLLVLAIFTITASAAIPKLRQSGVNKQISAVKSSLGDIADAIRVYDQRYSTALVTGSSALQTLGQKGLIYYVDSTHHDFQNFFTYTLLSSSSTAYVIQAVSTFTPTKTVKYTLNKANRSIDSTAVT